jgi:hypothetical protein
MLVAGPKPLFALQTFEQSALAAWCVALCDRFWCWSWPGRFQNLLRVVGGLGNIEIVGLRRRVAIPPPGVTPVLVSCVTQRTACD